MDNIRELFDLYRAELSQGKSEVKNLEDGLGARICIKPEKIRLRDKGLVFVVDSAKYKPDEDERLLSESFLKELYSSSTWITIKYMAGKILGIGGAPLSQTYHEWRDSLDITLRNVQRESPERVRALVDYIGLHEETNFGGSEAVLLKEFDETPYVFVREAIAPLLGKKIGVVEKFFRRWAN